MRREDRPIDIAINHDERVWDVLCVGIASSLAPEVQGNGQHVNESFYAGMRCWIVGLPVLAAGLYRFLLLVLRSAGKPIGQRDGVSQDRAKITKGQG